MFYRVIEMSYIPLSMGNVAPYSNSIRGSNPGPHANF